MGWREGMIANISPSYSLYLSFVFLVLLSYSLSGLLSLFSPFAPLSLSLFLSFPPPTLSSRSLTPFAPLLLLLPLLVASTPSLFLAVSLSLSLSPSPVSSSPVLSSLSVGSLFLSSAYLLRLTPSLSLPSASPFPHSLCLPFLLSRSQSLPHSPSFRSLPPFSLSLLPFLSLALYSTAERA